MIKGEYRKAYDEVNRILSSKSLSDEEQLSIQHIKCQLLRYLGEFESLIEFSQNVQTLAKSLSNTYILIDTMFLEIFAHYRLNKIELVQNLLNKAEGLLPKIKKKEILFLKSKLHHYRTYACIAEGDFIQAEKHAQEYFQLSNKLDMAEILASAYYILGWVYMHNGDMNRAIDNYKESLRLREELNNNPYDLSHSLFGLGYVYKSIGEPDSALTCLNKSKEIREKIGNKQDIAWTLLNLGDVLFQKKDIKKAQQFYDDALMITQGMNYSFGIIFSLLKLSAVYEILTEPQLVLDTLEKALDYAKDLEDVDPEVYCLFDLIKYIVENNIKSEHLKEYVTRLREINQSYTSKIFNQIYRLSQALILNSKKEKRSQNKARNIFREISEEEIIGFDYTRIAMQKYSKLLAEEINRYVSDENITSQLTELSERINPEVLQKSYTSVAENFLDLSQIALEEVDIKKARELLKRAQTLCDFLNLYNKGSTPFRIIYSLFVKERSLNELSRILKITKGALSSQLKLLVDLEIVRISKEEQIRSATMLKKYYSLGPKGLDLLEPLNMNLCECLKNEEGHDDYLIGSLMKPRLLTRIIRDATFLTDNFQNFLEEQVIMKSSDSSKKVNNSRTVNEAKNLLHHSDMVQIEQFLLSENQYQKYKELWKEFSEKVRTEIIKENVNSPKFHSTEKPFYVTNLVVPLNDLMALERHQLKKRKINEKAEED